ncbi:MAG: hypothetical protein F6K28_29955 [Microcoleus sp. SIO2G3]|nr:hypothetical protein [Microcoleus sp. SIO2G3]
MLTLLLVGCSQTSEPTRSLPIEQQWQLQPGDTIAGRQVAGGLGDISIEMNGDAVYAPADGRVQPIVNNSICVVFEAPEIPAYVFRLCGIRRPKLGLIQRGEAIGTADALQFAALRRQPDGKWAMVEPSRQILEQTLNKS